MIVLGPIVRMVAKMASVAVYLLTAISAYGGMVNPRWFALPSVLVLALPYLAILSMILAVVWLASGRYVVGIAGLVILGACWGPISSVLPIHTAKSETVGRHVFKLMTYNILHGYDQENPNADSGNRSIEYIINSDADLVGLQEMISLDKREVPNFTNELRDSLLKKYPYRAGTTNSDLKVLSRYPVRLIQEYWNDEANQVQYALYEVKMPWGKLHWINMHLTSYMLTDEERGVIRNASSVNGAKESIKEIKSSILSKLKSSFKSRAKSTESLLLIAKDINGPLIVSGDMNDVPSSYCYRQFGKAGFRDAVAETSFGPNVTYNRHGFFFRLDQIFLRGGLRPLSIERGNLKSSDHYPLISRMEVYSSSI